MKKIYMIWLLTLSLVITGSALASKPVCKSTTSGVPLLQYYGKVSRIYINSGNIILVYFEQEIDVAEAADCGIGITNGSAAAYKVDNNPEFAKLFYSTALAAQASGRNILIQMYGTQNGYPQFDRIWLAE